MNRIFLFLHFLLLFLLVFVSVLLPLQPFSLLFREGESSSTEEESLPSIELWLLAEEGVERGAGLFFESEVDSG